MTGTHFDVAVQAVTAALDTRLRPGITTFPDLFTADAVIEAPFGGDGSTSPITGRAAIAAMVDTLDGVLRFDEVTVTDVHDVDPATVVFEYGAVLRRADLGGRYRRRYICVITLRGGRIAHLREYGGPFVALPPPP